MSVSDILRPRKGVLSGDGVDGIIDLENRRDTDGKHIEARPSDFLDLTYPTSDIRFVLENLHRRYTKKSRSAGLYLFEGYKGSGKSHLLLLIHHLAQNKELAKRWLAQHGLECDLPDRMEVIVHKFTDFPLHTLWDLILQPSKSREDRPDLNQLRKSIEGRHLFLILDELEMGIRSVSNDAVRDQNLAFLQMMTEEAERSDVKNITIFASIYDSAHEPGATLKRVPRIDVKFANADDRAKIVLHRLFENGNSSDKKKINNVLTSYLNDWKRKGIRLPDGYPDRLQASYPFSPELIHLVQEQARNQFQGTRGALGLLGAIVKTTHRKADLITAAHASVGDRGILNRLIDLDPGMTRVKCAQNDLADLGKNRFADEIVSSVLLSTLASAGKTHGMTEDQLALQVLKPGDDINEFGGTLRAFHKYGTYFHEQEGVYYFDPEEKPNAKVEYKSLGVEPAKALQKAFDFWTGELFGDREAVVFQNIEQTQAEVRLRDNRRLRYVLSPRRLSPEDRHGIYYGQANRNLLILLEPRNKDFDAIRNQDIVKWAQRYIAANDLQNTCGAVERARQFERIAREDKTYILDAFRKAGFVFVSIQKYGADPGEDRMEIEQLGNACSKTDVQAKLSQQFFPVQLFEEHIRDHKDDFIGKRLRDIERIYAETLGYPVPAHVTIIRGALSNLCVHREIGLRHGKESACGRKPILAESEWPDVVVAEPFLDEQADLELRRGETPMPATTPTSDDDAVSKGTGNVTATSERESLVPAETPFVRSAGALRQEVAIKLAEHEDALVKEITFRIFYEKKNADLGSLPGGLRGALTGLGDITADLTITRFGNFDKNAVEQIAETLPQFPDGSYKAEMKVLHPAGERAHVD